MVNFETPNSEYRRIENTLAEMTPDPRHFEGSVYPHDEVKKDLEQLDAFKHTPEYKKGEERSDAKLLEKTFTDMAERGDWFGEEEAYGDDPDFLALVTFPTSEIDDTFNHIDVIGIIGNTATDHKTLPFAIDLTYNTDYDKMSQKFRWKHIYGKKDTAPEEASEFGESYIDIDYHGKSITKTKPLPLKHKYGLKIPGFASAKYFEDKNDPWDPIHDKGRIAIMPRFIVGYSTNIADALSSGMPTEEYRNKYGEAAYQKKRAEYKKAEKRAKWCTLLECSKQATDIRYMLENLTPEETKWMSPEELDEAKEQIAAMETYFTKAIETAAKQAKEDPNEMAAKKYAEQDLVCQEISYHSSNTYTKRLTTLNNDTKKS